MDAFIRLTTCLTNPALTIDRKLKMICEVTAELISGADRISLWRFEDDYSKIVSSVSYDSSKNKFEDSSELHRKDFTPYFDAIINQNVIKASDARNHPATECFTELYFEPNNIYSLLDFILHEDFNPIGVICCESLGNIYEWSEKDVQSLRRIARASSLYFRLDSES
ncbi:GAF domain-containing protein [Paraglaciecola aestuariivivens]